MALNILEEFPLALRQELVLLYFSDILVRFEDDIDHFESEKMASLNAEMPEYLWNLKILDLLEPKSYLIGLINDEDEHPFIR